MVRYRDIYAQHLKRVLSPEAWEEKDVEEELDLFYFRELPRDFRKTNPQDMKCMCEIHLAFTPCSDKSLEDEAFAKHLRRCIAFLESDRTYAWKHVRPQFYQSLIAILTLGVINPYKESLKAQGDIDYWPFVSQDEYLSTLAITNFCD